MSLLRPLSKSAAVSSRLYRAAGGSLRTLATEVPSHPAYKDGEADAKPKAVKDRQKSKKHHLTEGVDLPPLKNNPTVGFQSFDSAEGRKYNLRGIDAAGNVTGTPIFLPNSIIRMVRNGTLPGEPYNPYQATFHVPPSFTKNDIKSYLLAVYGVETTYINTELPHIKEKPKGVPLKSYRKKPSFKRAIVGLVDPFYYPDDPADMSTAEREAYEESLNDRGKGIMERIQKLPPQAKAAQMNSIASHHDEYEQSQARRRLLKSNQELRDAKTLESVSEEVMEKIGEQS